MRPESPAFSIAAIMILAVPRDWLLASIRWQRNVRLAVPIRASQFHHVSTAMCRQTRGRGLETELDTTRVPKFYESEDILRSWTSNQQRRTANTITPGSGCGDFKLVKPENTMVFIS